MGETAGDGQRMPLRTVDVARASGYSVQQVRDLERLGVIPPATRSGNGYRAYELVHVRALGAYRGVAGAIGPVVARQLLAELRTQPIADAAAAIDAAHVRLARERDEALRAQQALQAIEGEQGASDRERAADAMTITELAAALGVRPSTLRFWEQEELVVPERVTTLRARRYPLRAIHEARIVAALRNAGYGIPSVREIIGSLRALDRALDGAVDEAGNGIGDAARILQQRLDEIAARSIALMRAGGDLAWVIESVSPPRPLEPRCVPSRRSR